MYIYIHTYIHTYTYVVCGRFLSSGSRALGTTLRVQPCSRVFRMGVLVELAVSVLAVLVVVWSRGAPNPKP